MRNILPLAFTVLAACSSGPTVYEQKYEAKKAEYIAKFISFDCNKKMTGSNECGLIYPIDKQSESMAAFMHESCASVKPDKCAELYTTQGLARLKLRYDFADWSKILLKCEAYPKECDNLSLIELSAISSHDELIKKSLDAERASIQSESDQVRNVRAKTINNALRPNKTIHCNTVGSQTTCN
jgi:hypothetical protein